MSVLLIRKTIESNFIGGGNGIDNSIFIQAWPYKEVCRNVGGEDGPSCLGLEEMNEHSHAERSEP